MTRRHFGWIRKRNSGRWQIVYWHEGIRRSGGTFGTKSDAQAALAQIETDLRRGTWVDVREGSLSVAEYGDLWISHRPDLSIRTRELYEYLLSRYINPVLGRTEIGKLTSAQVRSWHAELSTRLPSTASKSYRLLSTMLRTAVADGRILNSPCTVRGASVEHAPERPIADAREIGALAEAMPTRMRTLVLLAAWCQLRRGEILGLQRKDIDLEDGTITIQRSRTFGRDGRSIVKNPKTRASSRKLAIPNNLIPLLEEHLDRFCEPQIDSLVFTGEKGGPLSAGVLQKWWSRARLEIARPDLHFHDLRHSGLTIAAEMGATTAELMHRAGHSSPDAALRYQHATRERDRKLASLIGNKIDPETLENLLS